MYDFRTPGTLKIFRHLTTTSCNVFRTMLIDYFHPEHTAPITCAEIFQLIRYRHDDARADVIAEIADYLGIPFADAENNFKIGEVARKDWDAFRPATKEQVESYYQSTNGYIYDLMAAFYELRENNLKLINNIIALIRVTRSKKILDFGAGAGCYTLPLQRLGADVTYADLPGKTAQFAAWLFQTRQLNIPIRDASDWDGLGIYDFIYLFSVLEHTFDPVAIMRNLKNHLMPTGHIYLQNDFSNSEPMHLQKNLHFAKSFAQELQAIGYDVVRNFDNGLMVVTHR